MHQFNGRRSLSLVSRGASVVKRTAVCNYKQELTEFIRSGANVGV